MRYFIAIFSISFFITFSSSAQGPTFEPPAMGKTAIYFARLNPIGVLSLFDFFHYDKFIGSLSGRGYFRYECEPGKQLFWAMSENKEFLTSDLQANAIYLVIADVNVGVMVARVGLRPVDATDSAVPKVESMLEKKPGSNYTAKELKERNEEFAFYVPSILKSFEKQTAKGKIFPHIAPQMAIRVLVTNPE